MGRKYTTQPFRIELSFTEKPIGTTSAKIRYRNPRGEQGDFNASIDDVNKKVYYESTAGEHLSLPGYWRFWSIFVVSGGEYFPGEHIEERIYSEGEK